MFDFFAKNNKDAAAKNASNATKREENNAVASQDTTPTKSNIFSRAKSRVVDLTTSTKAKIDNVKSIAKAKYDKTQKTAMILFVVWNILSVLFYCFSAIMSMRKNWNDSPLAIIVLLSTVVYAFIFIIIILINRRNYMTLKGEMTQYKHSMKLLKIVLNLINTIIALMVLINVLQTNNILQEPIALFTFGVSLLWVLIQFFSIAFKIVKWVKSGKKMKKKQLLQEEKLISNNETNAK